MSYCTRAPSRRFSVHRPTYCARSEAKPLPGTGPSVAMARLCRLAGALPLQQRAARLQAGIDDGSLLAREPVSGVPLHRVRRDPAAAGRVPRSERISRTQRYRLRILRMRLVGRSKQPPQQRDAEPRPLQSCGEARVVVCVRTRKLLGGSSNRRRLETLRAHFALSISSHA